MTDFHKLKHFCFLLLLLFFSTILKGQPGGLSLEEAKAYVENNVDSIAGHYADHIAYFYGHNNLYPDSAIYYSKKVLSIGQQLDNEMLIGMGWANTGSYYFQHTIPGHTDSVEFYAQKGIEFLKDKLGTTNKTFIGVIYGYLGKKAYQYDHDAERAFDLYQKAVDCAKEGDDGYWFMTAASNQIQVYYDEGLYEKVIELVNKSLEIAKTLTIDTSINFLDGNRIAELDLEILKSLSIGKMSTEGAKDRNLLQPFHEIFPLLRTEEMLLAEISYRTAMVDVFKDLLGKDSTLIYAEGAYRILKQYHPDFRGKEDVLLMYGEALMDVNRHSEALPVLEEGYVYSQLTEKDYFTQKKALNLLIKTNIELDNQEPLAAYFAEYETVSDSFTIQEKRNSIEKIEALYALEKAEFDNASLQTQNRLIKSRSNLFLIIGGLLLTLLILGIYFFLKLRKNKQHLEKINHSKNHLFAILAHDLKGPSASFNDLSEKISFLIRKKKFERLGELADYFEEAGNKLNYVLSNLLDWALSQKDEISHSPQRFVIKQEIDEVIKNLDYLAKEKNINIQNNVAPETAILFDKNAFSIVLRNLLHNAVKYSHQDSTVLVEANPEKRELLVRDAGVGMDKKLIDKIIQELPVESKKGTGRESGNGIGMSTCVKLIRKNGGTIKIDSKIDEGTTFVIAYQ